MVRKRRGGGGGGEEGEVKEEGEEVAVDQRSATPTMITGSRF